MWNSMLTWMSAATFWDWFWHIIAVGLVLVASIPGIWWPAAVRFFSRWAPPEEVTHDEHEERPVPNAK